MAGSSCPPLGNRSDQCDDGLAVEGRSVEVPDASFTTISPDYFRTMGIPLKQGRAFWRCDRDGSPSVAIVNEIFRSPLFPQ